MMRLFWLSDEVWADPHLLRGKPGKPRVDDRRVIKWHFARSHCDMISRYSKPATPSDRKRSGALAAAAPRRSIVWPMIAADLSPSR
jgi:hypothetical protein